MLINSIFLRDGAPGFKHPLSYAVRRMTNCAQKGCSSTSVLGFGVFFYKWFPPRYLLLLLLLLLLLPVFLVSLSTCATCARKRPQARLSFFFFLSLFSFVIFPPLSLSSETQPEGEKLMPMPTEIPIPTLTPTIPTGFPAPPFPSRITTRPLA